MACSSTNTRARKQQLEQVSEGTARTNISIKIIESMLQVASLAQAVDYWKDFN